MRVASRKSVYLVILSLASCFSISFLPPGAVDGRGFHRSARAEFRVDATKGRISESYGHLPLGFEANQGQFDGQVKFLARGSGYNLFLTSTEAVIQLRNHPVGHLPAPTDNGQLTTDKSAVVRMQLVGADPDAPVRGLDALPGKTNYLIGNDPRQWHTEIANYRQVQYEGIYPGIDLIYYGNQRQLEYDFVVAPGADPRLIRLSFAGVDRLDLDAEGQLVLHTAGQTLRQHKPVIYQEIDGERVEVEGAFRIQDPESKNPTVGFEVAQYDQAQPLVIDPVLVYCTYLGGSTYEFPHGIAADVGGNAYVIGSTTSTNFPTMNPLQPTPRGGLCSLPPNTGGLCNDGFVSKLNPTGTALLYSTYVGGSGHDIPLGIALDLDGNAYVAGVTGSTDFPRVNPLQFFYGGGDTDAFVFKLNSSGSALGYSTFLGGSGDDASGPNTNDVSIAVDAAGSAYVTGDTDSSNFPTVNAFQPAYGGGGVDAFVAKLNPSGAALIYSTYLGGSLNDAGRSIAADAAGNAYVTGFTVSTNFPIANALQPVYGGGANDCFVAKLNPGGSALVYSTYLGGTLQDQGRSIAIDTTGNAYLAGNTGSADFPSVNAFQPVFGGGATDAFVAELNPRGSALIYSSYLGGAGADTGSGIAVDTAGNAHIAGRTASTNLPTLNALQPVYGGGAFDHFVAKLNVSGSALIYSTYLGGSDNENALYTNAVDAAGNHYVTGQTSSTNLPLANPLQPAYGGGATEGYVAKIAP
ncbi:MAG: SBBP repeat-containing protein [Acidobacteria bacterium]|nr:SBBP repeat-containing protein [Acidobacteriota bacterium]